MPILVNVSVRIVGLSTCMWTQNLQKLKSQRLFVLAKFLIQKANKFLCACCSWATWRPTVWTPADDANSMTYARSNRKKRVQVGYVACVTFTRVIPFSHATIALCVKANIVVRPPLNPVKVAFLHWPCINNKLQASLPFDISACDLDKRDGTYYWLFLLCFVCFAIGNVICTAISMVSTFYTSLPGHWLPLTWEQDGGPDNTQLLVSFYFPVGSLSTLYLFC